jgi:hypothetical protein
MSATSVFCVGALQTTDGEIARINLESARCASWNKFFAGPLREGTAESVIEHEQVAAQFCGDGSVLDRVEFLAAEVVKADPVSWRTRLIQAQVASMAHRFADARHYLAPVDALEGAPARDVLRLRLNIDQACGENLNAVLKARRDQVNESHRLQDLVALASLLADLRLFADADRTYKSALDAYQDVSPFPIAWICFELGVLWGELVPEPAPSLAAQWYERAIKVLPSHTKARVHLAEIYSLNNKLSEAEALLTPAIDSGDPEVRWRLADVMAAQGKHYASQAHLQAARAGFDSLLERHLLAFADHGAEFYAGVANDFRRALDLACVNIANRPTLRAFEQGYAIAVSGGDQVAAKELCSAAAMRWSGTAAFRLSSLAQGQARRLRGAAV